MPIYNNKRLSPGIFSNPLLKVKIGRLYYRAVAAINASGNVNLLANIPYNVAGFFSVHETGNPKSTLPPRRSR